LFFLPSTQDWGASGHFPPPERSQPALPCYLLVSPILALQCTSTLAAMARQTGGWRWHGPPSMEEICLLRL